jgi:hypothetical protein
MTEQWIPKDKAELMAALQREWHLLIAAADNLTDKQMTTADAGGWSPKDNLAHLSEWMNALMGYHLDRRPRHQAMRLPQEVVEDWDFEIINPALFERNRYRSSEDVQTELRETYKQLFAKLDSMSFDDLLKPRHADDPEKRPILMWVLGDTTEHFLEHRETIEKAIKS